MFQLFKKKKTSEIMLGAPLKGKAVSLQEVNDPTFSSEMLGKGVAIIPVEGCVYAPTAGKINMVFDTSHAISLISPEGVEILIHVGIDTVKMKGEGFTVHVQTDYIVQKGDLLLTADLEKIKAAGYDTITPMIICNTEEYGAIKALTAEAVESGDDVLQICFEK